jgi:molybdopterin-containing oxidoreductase family membrane subunit
MPTLVGVFEDPLHVAEAVRKLRGRGFARLEVYAPAPFEEVEMAVDPKPSRVRYFTLAGGLLGVVTGYAMTIWMSLDWPIVIGGKPYASIPPYTVIAFELTILFGGIFTLLGLLAVGRLPAVRLGPGYTARFSAEDFGVAVEVRDRDVAEVDGLLRASHAKEVDLVRAA